MSAALVAEPAYTAVRRLPLGPAYAANQVNATIFRLNAVVSAGPFQYACWYDPTGHIVVAQRQLDSETWDTVTLDAAGSLRDAHNCVVIGVSPDGLLHLSYDHHGNPLRYRRSTQPHDIRSFGPASPMTGQTESRVTYPQFVSAPDGTFYFFYRDGSSGNGNLCLNRWNTETATWTPLHHPLIDGQNQCNPYWWRPSFGPDGSLHLGWCWRSAPDARTNHDICYVRSDDKGVTWKTVEGNATPVPVTPDNAPVADAVPIGSNLINQCSSAVDSDGHPHLAHYQDDAPGVPQYTHLWHDGTSWRRNTVGKRVEGFSLAGGGTLQIPISRPEIAIAPDGTVFFITRDEATGGGIRAFRSSGTEYQAEWTALDLTPPGEDLGHWEPSYDTVRWREQGVLSLFVLSVRQGNHETVTDFAPQEASIREIRLR